MTPGQAAWEEYRAIVNGVPGERQRPPWEDLNPEVQANWEREATARRDGSIGISEVDR